MLLKQCSYTTEGGGDWVLDDFIEEPYNVFVGFQRILMQPVWGPSFENHYYFGFFFQAAESNCN